MKILNKILGSGICIALLATSFAENLPLSESAVISEKLSKAGGGRIKCSTNLRCSLSLTSQFYKAESNLPVWSSNGKPLPMTEELLSILNKSYQDGLDPHDYHVVELTAMLARLGSEPANNPQLLADLDVTLSDAFLLYAKHMVYGRLDNAIAYPDWIISKRSANLLTVLGQAIHSRNVVAALASITPQYSGYAALKNQLIKYQEVAAQGGWESIPLVTPLAKGAKGKKVALLEKRLNATGELASINSNNLYTATVAEAVKVFQAENGLKVSGQVDKKTLQSLNIPVLQRIRTLELNLDRLRWLPLDMGEKYVLVNIPDFSLEVVDENKTILSMPVIVGKETNRSCILSSQITYLELNPYWTIPDSIARKEILPKLQKNPAYLAPEQIKVFTNLGNNGTEVNPLKVNWKAIKPEELAYKFRQMPGDKNALGKVKFIFPNACGIYLHDTPSRNLFGRSRRDFSHGCIRIGKPIDMADFLLQDKPQWTPAKIDEQIAIGKRLVVTLASPVDVHILYATAWVNESGSLEYRNDIYKIDAVDYPVYLPERGAK